MSHKRHWDGREIWELYLRYEKEGPRQLAIELQRTENAVTSQARRLRLQSLTRRARQGHSCSMRRRAARDIEER